MYEDCITKKKIPFRVQLCFLLKESLRNQDKPLSCFDKSSLPCYTYDCLKLTFTANAAVCLKDNRMCGTVPREQVSGGLFF